MCHHAPFRYGSETFLLLMHNVIVAMRCTQGSGIACTEPLDGIRIRQALHCQLEDCFGEPECRELCMHRLGVVVSIDRGRITKRNMPNRHTGFEDTACQCAPP